nr:hypothetical protein [Mycolicibacterium sphagni]
MGSTEDQGRADGPDEGHRITGDAYAERGRPQRLGTEQQADPCR